MSGTPTALSDRPRTRHLDQRLAPPQKARTLVPGVALSMVAALVAFGVSRFLPGVSPLIVAIVLGVLSANIVALPATVTPGLNLSSKKLLRAGIVLLGLQVSLADIRNLGAPLLLVVVAVIAGGLLGTVALGRLLRVRSHLTLLVACGFSICGAAAVAGAAGVTDPDDEAEEDTITAVALVVIFGTLMIPLVPALAHLLALDTAAAGMWAGGSIHEIAQVVAVGGVLGGAGLTTAVLVKLTRVLMLAPVMAALSLRERRRERTGGATDQVGGNRRRPPIVPLFVVGFLGMVLVRSVVAVPAGFLDAGQVLQTLLLAAAMFGLGCGVRVTSLVRVGFRPFALAGLSTVLVAVLALAGVLLVA
ncbi:putative sulfate exporter family transporter [Flavimobilis sp. GY10621]|uniref:Sulfate exporter family transporter n=1 Tax=Flavimobilis rhizosphaerae TaxID=2775421 RepID=A0ABR9DR11_9MICO|nr:putative sulfate exporter family transporter [Flavimobilis rhizosphaerae]MBD9699577.1 putative sulfate exporter family transporter [Flavimobilis rhizosphaerae]